MEMLPAYRGTSLSGDKVAPTVVATGYSLGLLAIALVMFWLSKRSRANKTLLPTYIAYTDQYGGNGVYNPVTFSPCDHRDVQDERGLVANKTVLFRVFSFVFVLCYLMLGLLLCIGYANRGVIFPDWVYYTDSIPPNTEHASGGT